VPEHALDGRLAEALQIREAISQAQGAIMARDGLSSDDAYTTLWRLSRRSGRPLRELAADVIASTQPAPLPETAIDGGDPFE
jgi:AmiR/NasT family two-component response regulator